MTIRKAPVKIRRRLCHKKYQLAATMTEYIIVTSTLASLAYFIWNGGADETIPSMSEALDRHQDRYQQALANPE